MYKRQGAASAISTIIPELENKLNGIAFRVPTSTVSVVDLVTNLKQSPTLEEINAAFKDASDGPMQGYLSYESDELVSSDFKKHDASCIYDSKSTLIVNPSLIKTVGWYDNEWGYACRIMDLCSLISQKEK